MNWDSFEAACKFEEHDDYSLANLEVMYSLLAPLYTTLRHADKFGPYCDYSEHRLHGYGAEYRIPSEEDLAEVRDAFLKISRINRVISRIDDLFE